MAHGKDAARDARYGRRGGRWATDQGLGLTAEIDRIRQRELAAGTWPIPGQSIDPNPCKVCDKPRKDHGTPCPICRETPEHHSAGGQAACRAGLARMAAARRAAGSPLTDLDLEVLAEQDQLAS